LIMGKIIFEAPCNITVTHLPQNQKSCRTQQQKYLHNY
jgi:hypothetical protein